MSRLLDDFRRLKRNEECPVCGHAEWCLVANDGKRVICARAESRIRCADAGWLHYLEDPRPAIQSFAKESAGAYLDCDAILQRYMLDTTTFRLEGLAQRIGVTTASLRRLGCVWAERHGAWAFPMRTPDNKVVGIRLRNDDGDKWAVKGSKQGLFIPQPVGPDKTMLLICEGPTDTAAILDLGFEAIGRPSCNGCENEISEIVRNRKSDPVIAANYDQPKINPITNKKFYPGQDGAFRLEARLSRPARIIYPPKHKDFRAWVNAGATPQTIQALIKAARYGCKKPSGLALGGHCSQGTQQQEKAAL